MLAFSLTYIRNKWAWALFIPFLVCMRAMMLTFSRGAKLAFYSSIFVALFLWNKKIFFGFILPLVFFFIAYPSFIPRIFFGRLTHTFKEKQTSSVSLKEPTLFDRLDRSSLGRLYVWMYGLKVVQDHPFFGVGFGQFGVSVSRYAGYPPARRMAHRPASHNTYLMIAVEMGGIALIFFLTLLLILFLAAVYIYRRSTDVFYHAVSIGFIAGLWGLLVSNMFGFRITSNEIVFHFWILAAVIMRIKEFTIKEIQSPDVSSETPARRDGP
jgi:O-antigen ligase